MGTLSTTAWVAHDLGLASAFGGALFGKLALEPAVSEVSNRDERARVENRAWKRFSLWNGVGLGTVAISWLVGRKLLSGREVSGLARGLTIAKDVLVGGSVAVAVATTALGRRVGRAKLEHEPPERVQKLNAAVNRLGDAQLVLTAGLIGVTSVLAMQAGRSARFSLAQRMLP